MHAFDVLHDPECRGVIVDALSAWALTRHRGDDDCSDLLRRFNKVRPCCFVEQDRTGASFRIAQRLTASAPMARQRRLSTSLRRHPVKASSRIAADGLGPFGFAGVERV